LRETGLQFHRRFAPPELQSAKTVLSPYRQSRYTSEL
jgi:hypothetical protein